MYSISRLFALIGLVLLLAGCRGPREVSGPSMRLTIAGQPELNAGGNAAVIKVYQLRGGTNFNTTPLQSFWQNDRTALSDDYVDHVQLLLYPNESETVPLDLRAETQFIGIAADLRDPAQDGWRRIFSLDELRGKEVNVSVGADRLLVEVK